MSAPQAGFWVRTLATLIDWLILWAISLLLGALVSAVGMAFKAPLALGGLRSFLMLAIWAGYFIFFWTRSGQTPGHTALGLRVVRVDGQSLDPRSAVVRCLGEILCYVALGLGFIWVGLDTHKQGWHDKLARTYVVRVARSQPASPADAGVATLGDLLGGGVAHSPQS